MPLKRILSLFVLCLCLSAPLVGQCADTTTAAQDGKIVMSQTQYNQLKETIRQQEKTLATLQDRLNRLDSNSTTLQQQLTQAKEQLTTTKQSLTTADSSLSQASEALNRQSQSLETLTKQINEMTQKQARLERQRDVWATVAGAFLIGCIVK